MNPENRQQLEQLIVRYLEQRRVLHWSPRTIDSYRSHLKCFLIYLDTRSDVEDITSVTPDILRDYQTFLYSWTDDNGRGRTLATQAGRLSALRSFFRDLVQTGTLVYDPASSLTLPKRRRRLPRMVPTKREMMRLLATPDLDTPLGLRDRAMMEVLYSTGIRNAELRMLRVHDIDLNRGTLTVDKGKNGRDRVVPLGREASEALRAYFRSSRPRLLGARASGAEETVFLSKSGRPLLTLGVIVPVRKHARTAGISRPVTPHTLRHACATHMLQGRADIRYIQVLLGHGSVATTQLYTQVDVTDLKSVHRRCHPRERQLRCRQA